MPLLEGDPTTIIDSEIATLNPNWSDLEISGEVSLGGRFWDGDDVGYLVGCWVGGVIGSDDGDNECISGWSDGDNDVSILGWNDGLLEGWHTRLCGVGDKDTNDGNEAPVQLPISYSFDGLIAAGKPSTFRE